jgi:hypothetical protein
MSQVLADWDSRVFDSFSSNDDAGNEDYELPMPIFVSTN